MFLETVETEGGKELPLRWAEEAKQILDGINQKRETRLLFDTMLQDDCVLRLLTTHHQLLSPVEIVAEELDLPGEIRPFIKAFPIPLLVHTHGGEFPTEDDMMMAAASASVDAKMFWDSIFARINKWTGTRPAQALPLGQQKALDLDEEEKAETIATSEEMKVQLRTALDGIDSTKALETFARGLSNVAGGEALPLLSSLPLLPLGLLTRIGIRHRDRILKHGGLEVATYTKALQKLVTARVVQVGFSMFCCKGHKDHPFAFLALGQSSPPSVACAICDKDLPGLTYYHFEPTTSNLLRRPGGILEPMAWRAFEDAHVAYAPMVQLKGIDEYERDAIFASNQGGYGIVECKIWMRRVDKEAKREQFRRALAKMERSVSSMAKHNVKIDYAILATNRYESDVPDLIDSVINESNLNSLQSPKVVHLSPHQIDTIKRFAGSGPA